MGVLNEIHIVGGSVEILMTDLSGRESKSVAAELSANGHIVRACRDSRDSNATACAALRGDACPLDQYPIDAAVEVGPAVAQDGLANAGLCAPRRRIPLVLVDRPCDPLERRATESVPHSKVAATVGALESAELPARTAQARRAVLDELARNGNAEATTDSVVRRRNGGLLIELATDTSVG